MLINMDKESFLMGSISGTAQMIVGHPLDTIKVWKQNKININFKRMLGLRTLYRGVGYPIVASSLYTGVQFNSYHANPNIIGGITAGVLSGAIIGPFDYYKIRSQVKSQGITNLPLYPMRGFWITIVREVPSMVCYFSSYYYFRDKQLNPFISGGLAGMTSWAASYPFDTLKTRVQTGSNLKQAIQMGNLYNGLSYCLFRAFIVNGTGFTSAFFLQKYFFN